MKNKEFDDVYGVIPVWGLFQANKLGAEGIGMKNRGSSSSSPPTLFLTRKEAENWLEEMMITFRAQQGVGARTADNFVPEKGLDFYISRIFLVFDKRPMQGRGWDFDKSNEWIKYKFEHPDKRLDQDEAEELIKKIESYERDN